MAAVLGLHKAIQTVVATQENIEKECAQLIEAKDIVAFLAKGFVEKPNISACTVNGKVGIV